MQKRTAVIDIGSNSARLVIFQQTSQYGFHLIHQQKSSVRISENAYANQGMLQPNAIARAMGALRSFTQTIAYFKADTVMCIATSALRDAPNGSWFIDEVHRKFGISIDIIDGDKEAYYGAVAVTNLLPTTDGITVDIGGGSADMALIRQGEVIATHSLNLGHVRLKELLADNGASEEKILDYIHRMLRSLPDSFRSHTVIGIGGTARSLAKSIMKKTAYPLDKIHAFNYSLDQHNTYLYQLARSSRDVLNSFYIKKQRHDTIREGALIFLSVCKHVGADRIMTSGVGIREGAYLSHLLSKKSGHQFPESLNPSIVSIMDRFSLLGFPAGSKKSIGEALCKIFADKLGGDADYRFLVSAALSLSNIGKTLTIYKEHQHAYYIAKQELNFGFTHQEMMLIALLLNTNELGAYSKDLYKKYASILPKKKVVKWLAFLYRLATHLCQSNPCDAIEFAFHKGALHVKGSNNQYLIHQDIEKMKMPDNLIIVFEN